MKEHYIGKDMVHYGSGIVIDPGVAFHAIARSARKNIRKAEKEGFDIQRRTGTAEELRQFRSIWYYPDDPNFPVELSENDILYLAYLKDELVGGMILIPVGRHLFLNNLAASDEGKKHQLQGYMLWHAVNDLKDSGYRYIDIGVSYRVNLQRFFTKWASFRYPVIFNPPENRPRIGFRPFSRLTDVAETEPDPSVMQTLCPGRPCTLLPSVEYARRVAEACSSDWIEVAAPVETEVVQVIDLTELFPLQFGALLAGPELEPETLWSEFGCYDHFKTRYILSCLSLPGWDIASVRQARLRNYCRYLEYFENEDVKIIPAEGWIDGFRFACDDADYLAGRFAEFGVQVRREGNVLVFPCHQELSTVEIEYVYAIYRGYLNLCSEWQPTGVRGTIKLTGS